MNEFVKQVLSVAKTIQMEVPKVERPPEIGPMPHSEQVIAFSLVKGTRGYIEQVVNQINGCYEDGWFDACAVMIRRLIETLLVETFEHHNLSHLIKDSKGDFFYLNDLIDITLTATSWNLGRNAKPALRKLKSVGDLSAHNRRFVAHRQDIDKLIPELRVVAQELIYLAGFK